MPEFTVANNSKSITQLPAWMLAMPTLEFSAAIEAIKTGLQAIADCIRKAGSGAAAEPRPAAERLCATEAAEMWRGRLWGEWPQADGMKIGYPDDKKEAWKERVLYQEGINSFSEGCPPYERREFWRFAERWAPMLRTITRGIWRENMDKEWIRNETAKRTARNAPVTYHEAAERWRIC